ncbi:MAG: tRNA (adenosine(37)-N6)-threonylcarbamoyltransferase complex ATPase subunit type 1 TsaE [Bacteroidales bacterium]|nr:tRNA (adenosine(37)-N6)-threonylcarbamoyltransferase complex ATPase subunit type 1 TsaE [Bacteroidales bacterium]
MKKEFIINSLDEAPKTAREFLSYIEKEEKGKKCIVFDAPMGAGKTTFIKELCKALEVTDEVTSPTFSIVNEYMRKNGEKVYHFDLYRIKDLDEAMSAGTEEYIYGDDYCFIEWPEVIYPVLGDNVIEVQIRVTDDGKRVVSL